MFEKKQSTAYHGNNTSLKMDDKQFFAMIKIIYGIMIKGITTKKNGYITMG